MPKSVVGVALVAAVAMGVAGVSSAAAETRTVRATVPHGMYAHSDNPKCGVRGPLSHMSDPKVVSAVGATVGPKAAGVVLLIGTGANIAEQSGGDLAKWVQKATGGNDWASCAEMCIAAPAGKQLTKIQWSDRHGILGGVTLKEAKAGIPNKSTQDYSGWRDFTAFRNGNDQWVVCGTGTNWSHGQTATKRIEITYD